VYNLQEIPSPKLKQTEGETEVKLISCVEIKNAWNLASTPAYVFMEYLGTETTSPFNA
jgi:hypothetical protein